MVADMIEMKDSGIEGIDLVPENWDRVQLEHCADIIRGGSPRPIEQYMSDTEEGYSWIKIGDTEKGNKYITHVRERIISAGLSKTRYVKWGTLLLTNSMSFGEPYILKVNGCIHDGWLAFSNLRFVDKEFLYYFLVSPACRVQFEKASDGGVVQNLNIDKVKHSIIYFPSVLEQQAIVAFLDSKCAEIDALSADIQSEIDTLEAYKRSVITEAVTKGLDKNVPMKDSGIEWAKKVPAHWNVMQNKYIMKKVKNICPVYKGEDILSLTMNGVIVRDLDAGGKMPTSFNGYQKIYPGNLLMCLFDYDVTPRCIGLIKNEGLTSPAYSQFIMKNDNSVEYYYYYYLMIDFTKELLHLAKNLRHSFTEDQLGMITAPVPPVDEQWAISQYLDKRCAEIESIIAQKQEQISVLADYKKSVIYEYITGKKEVPYGDF